MATLWDQGAIAPRATKKNKNSLGGEKCPKANISFEGVLGSREPARMRKQVEMYTASRMQNMVQIRKKNAYVASSVFLEKLFWASRS